MKKFIPYDQNQTFLLPPSLDDLISEDHLARLVNEVVEQLDLRTIIHKYPGGGRPAYHPVLLLKILFYGYATGFRSSRQLERLCNENVVFMWLSANQRPDFHTISDFRKNFLPEIKELFVQIVHICKELGILKVGHWAIDGTKVKSNASRYKYATKETLEEETKQIKQEIEKALQEAQTIDEAEDTLYGKDHRGDELPKEIQNKQRRLKLLEKAINKLKEQSKKGSKSKRSKINPTEPEAKFMKRVGGGFDSAYNCQTTVDTESQIIVASSVSNQPVDNKELIPQIDQAKKNVGKYPEKLSADAGYTGGKNLSDCEERGIDTYIPQNQSLDDPKETKKASKYFPPESFVYEQERDLYHCPEEKTLPYHFTINKKTGLGTIKVRIYKGKHCHSCPQAKKCIPNPQKARTIRQSEYQVLVHKMRKKLKTSHAKEIYAKRKITAEPVIGQIKTVGQFRRFLLRGLHKASGEWALACLAHNLRKIWTAMLDPPVNNPVLQPVLNRTN